MNCTLPQRAYPQETPPAIPRKLYATTGRNNTQTTTPLDQPLTGDQASRTVSTKLGEAGGGGEGKERRNRNTFRFKPTKLYMIYSYIFLAIVSFRVPNNCVLCIHNLLALLFELELWGDDIEEEE